MKRWIADVSEDRSIETPLRQKLGLPPNLKGSADARSAFGPPTKLTIEQSDGGFLLIRWMSDGGFAGDTWHISFRDARDQADSEFAGAFIEWREADEETEKRKEDILKKTPKG